LWVHTWFIITAHDWRRVNDTTRKSNVEPLFPTLHSTLSSSRPNDGISGDIAELIGFDDIELVMEILDNRASIVQAVSTIMVFLVPNAANSRLQSFQDTSPMLLMSMTPQVRLGRGRTST
jgi:hypothetical protein